MRAVGLARPLNDFNFGWHALSTRRAWAVSTRRAWAVLGDLGFRVAARPINDTVRRHLCLVLKGARCAASLVNELVAFQLKRFHVTSLVVHEPNGHMRRLLIPRPLLLRVLRRRGGTNLETSFALVDKGATGTHYSTTTASRDVKTSS